MNAFRPTPQDEEQGIRDAEEAFRELYEKSPPVSRPAPEGTSPPPDWPVDPYDCTHDRTEIREWVYSNGAVNYRRQCLRCFMSIGQPIKKHIAFQEVGGRPRPFDVSARDEAIEALQRRREQERDNESREWWRRYTAYLQMRQWAERRRLVIERCRNICEGCRQAPVAEVHHLTYAHVGNELLYELVGLCLSCHGVAHDEDPAG